ncbi:MAG: hypothetical protein JRF60_08660 [Deltaproteobacteria bacterium]|nr:hypothetical protein [Deltaproteobacteria bacterium]MBW2563657.1 hypothetical protein [Deltaproteobacteria bacterium]
MDSLILENQIKGETDKNAFITIIEIKEYLYNKKITGRVTLYDRMPAKIDTYLGG